MASRPFGWPDVSHHWPAVTAVVAVAVAAAPFLYILSAERLHASLPSLPVAPLRRRNAIRRRRRPSVGSLSSSDSETSTSGDDEGAQELDGHRSPVAADSGATEVSFVDEDADGQRLKELMFAIAKHRAQKEGVVHRGVTCDNCNRLPIVGVRFHCTNCPDFDLCEDCEATDSHLKTHVFYKVKIPAPWGGKQPLPVWYPGKPRQLPDVLPQYLKKQMERELDKPGKNGNLLDGWYQQFSCLANTPWPKDPDGLNMAVDRRAFDRCFVPQNSANRMPKPNLVHDRLFAAYDRNSDGLIGFREFAQTSSDIQSDNTEIKFKRVFQGIDLDGDLFISRKDFLRMFSAWNALKKSILVDYMRADTSGEDPERAEGGHSPQDHVLRSAPIASYFTSDRPGFGPNPRESEGKTGGDVELPLLRQSRGDTDIVTRRDVVSRTWINPFQAVYQDLDRIVLRDEAQWITKDQARLFEEIDASEDQNWVRDGSHWWAKIRQAPGRSAYVKVIPNRDVGSEVSDEWAPEMHDKQLWERTLVRVCTRLTEEVSQALSSNADKRVEERRKYREFHLEDEDNVFSRPAPSLEDPPPYEADAITSGTRTLVARMTSEPRSGRAFRPFVGDTEAANTIYTVIQEALNELLDPIFKPCETKYLDYQASAADRADCCLEIHEARLANLSAPVLSQVYQLDPKEQSSDPDLIKMCENFEKLQKVFVSKLLPTWTHAQELSFATEVLDWIDMAYNSLMPDPSSTSLRWEGLRGFLTDNKAQSVHLLTALSMTDMPVLNEEQLASRDQIRFWMELEDEIAILEANKQPPGTLSLADFRRFCDETDDHGKKLLGWVGGWLDLVMF